MMRVGICVERSLEMVVGVLGILKAGGAYVPLDPSYPMERLPLHAGGQCSIGTADACKAARAAVRKSREWFASDWILTKALRWNESAVGEQIRIATAAGAGCAIIWLT